MKIGQLFLADIERDINPVIKVADLSQAELRSELEDYVVTEVIERYLLDFLEHYTETRHKETDRVGVWISGYVGSGKSHFAKILGLLTGNPQVEGRAAIDRFRPRIAPCRAAREIERHLYEVATFLHTEVVAFQINSVAIKGAVDDVCSILYRQFLAHRGLSTDLKLALLIEEPLIERGALETYRQAVQDLSGKPWELIRQRPMLYWDEIFEALARTLPDRFTSAAAARDAYDRSVVQPTFQQLAKDLAAYVARQQAQQRDREVRLLFIVDELGQFVADSGPRLLDVQSFAEEIATHGKGKIWLVVTSHESMHDVVKNAREFKGDIKKLEGRFSRRYTLTTENIERVLEERLFKKSKAGEDALREVYRRRGGILKDVGELVKVDRALPPCEADRFIACYPFLPYQLILIPDALHGLRVAGGRGAALTGAARSLLGIAQGILKHQGYAPAEVGRLVPLDEVYAEIEDAEIPSEVRRELSSVGARIPDQTFPRERILRALYLLQQVPYAPRTLDNLVRLLVSSVDVDFAAFRGQIEAGLNRSSRALDDVDSYLEAEARRGNVVTGRALVERYEGIPYGWDSNIARLCAAALFRSGALLLTLDKKGYRDPRDAEAQRTFLDSRRFDRAELRLESDLELSVAERMRAREQLHVLFGARPEETPAALAETLQQKLQERLTTLRGLAEWVRLTGFPVPTAYATAAESFERLVEERRPNTCVRQFLARLDEVSEQVRAADRLEAFFASPRRDEYERAQAMVSALRAAVTEGLATEPMRTAVAEYDGRSRDRELLDR